MKNKTIYSVPNEGFDELSVYDQFPIHFKEEPLTRSARRGMESEFHKNMLEMYELEENYCANVLEGDLIEPKRYYGNYSRMWLHHIKFLVNEGRFKYTTPNMYYFENKYKPVI